MKSVRLRLLGPPSAIATGDAQATSLRSAKCLALLAFLAVERGRHTRRELAALLWGDSDDAAARASLRQAIKRVRDTLGPALLAERSSVHLAPEVASDVREFLEACEHDPAGALGFQVERFLAGFTVPHASAFDDWLDATRRTLARRYEDALRATAQRAMARSQWRDAIAVAERWLACNPLSDEATRVAMEARHLGGDRAGALTAFREHGNRLRDEVGSAPSPALAELAAHIEHDPTTPIPPGRARMHSVERDRSAPSFEPTLHGREREWEELAGVWREVARGSGQVVIIEGESGVGKTRLADELMRWVSLEGATTLRGRGYDPRTSVPWGPIVEWLRAALEAPGLAGTPPEFLAEVSRLVPELRKRFEGIPEPPVSADAGDRSRLLEGVVQVILALAAERPVALFLDDLQWCDVESCGVLRLLSRRIGPVPVLLIGAIAPDEIERESAAARLCRTLRSENQATVVSLSALDEGSVWAIIRELGRIEDPAQGRRLASRIHEATDGNPFYLIELLKTLFARDLLSVEPVTGEWVVSPAVGAGGERVPMPRSVHDAIEQRVASLPYELRDLFATIAVAGRPVRPHLLSHVHTMSRLRAAALADALVERRLLVEDGGVYTVAHTVIADVVRDMLTPSRRRELHRAIALALAGPMAEEVPGEWSAGDIARHAERGGEPGIAFRYALEAHEEAARRFAPTDAVEWLDLASRVAPDERARIDVSQRAHRIAVAAGRALVPRRPSTPGYRIRRDDLDLREVEG